MDKATELLEQVADTAKKARGAETLGRAERTCAKYWNLHFQAVDEYKAHMRQGC